MPMLAIGDGTRLPRIAYQNLFNDVGVTVTKSTDTTGGEYQNAYDWLQYSYWIPSAAGASWIQAVLAAPKPVTYFAFYNQTVYINGGTIKLQYSLDAGSTWLDAASVIPTDNSPVYVTFSVITATYWRVLMTSTPASKLAVVSFGQDMICERGQWVGTTPPVFDRQNVVTTMVSNTGAFLGRSLIRTGNKATLAIDFLSVSWVRLYWLPFMVAIESQPFFYLHNPIDYPAEAGFCWIVTPAGDMVKCAYTSHKYMNAGFKASARYQ